MREGDGPRGPGPPPSNRRKASPNLPARRDLVPERDIDGRLDRLVCLDPLLSRFSFLFEGSCSSIARKNSTFELILPASVPLSVSIRLGKPDCRYPVWYFSIDGWFWCAFSGDLSRLRGTLVFLSS